MKHLPPGGRRKTTVRENRALLWKGIAQIKAEHDALWAEYYAQRPQRPERRKTKRGDS